MGNGFTPPVENSKMKGFFDASISPNGSPDYITTLLATGDYMVVNVAGTLTIGGVSTSLEVGNYITKTQTGYQVITPANPQFPGLTDGTMLKIVNNVAVAAGVRETPDRIRFDKSPESEAASIYIGTACRLSERGGLPAITSFVTGASEYMPLAKLMKQGENTVTEEPFYFKLDNSRELEYNDGAITQVSVADIDWVSPLNIPSQIEKLWIKSAANYSDVAFRIRHMGITGDPVIRYIPSQAAWEKQVTGMNLTTGLNKIFDSIANDADSPVICPPAELYKIGIRVGANYHADLLGDGIEPYLKISIQDANIKEVVTHLNNEQTLYVGKHGDDNNDGKSPYRPKLTIGSALSAITDASGSKRYAIMLFPGEYNEAITWKNNIALIGLGDKRSTIVKNNNTVLNTPNEYSLFANVTIELDNHTDNAQNAVKTSTAGVVYFDNCLIGGSGKQGSYVDAIEIDGGEVHINRCELYFTVGAVASATNPQGRILLVDAGDVTITNTAFLVQSNDEKGYINVIDDFSSGHVVVNDCTVDIEFDNTSWSGVCYVFGFFGSHEENINNVMVNASKLGARNGSIYPVYANSLSSPGTDVTISNSRISYENFSGSSKMVHVDQSDDLVDFVNVQMFVDGVKNFNKSGNGDFNYVSIENGEIHTTLDIETLQDLIAARNVYGDNVGGFIRQITGEATYNVHNDYRNINKCVIECNSSTNFDINLGVGDIDLDFTIVNINNNQVSLVAVSGSGVTFSGTSQIGPGKIVRITKKAGESTYYGWSLK